MQCDTRVFEFNSSILMSGLVPRTMASNHGRGIEPAGVVKAERVERHPVADPLEPNISNQSFKKIPICRRRCPLRVCSGVSEEL